MTLSTFLLAIGIATSSPLFASKLPVDDTQVPFGYVFTSKDSIGDYIESRAMYYGVNPKKALAIAKAESNLVINAKNSESTASGIYQFINGSFKYFCIEKYKMTDTMEDKNNPYIQIECATKLLGEGGDKHWSESSSKWSKHALNE